MFPRAQTLSCQLPPLQNCWARGDSRLLANVQDGRGEEADEVGHGASLDDYLGVVGSAGGDVYMSAGNVCKMRQGTAHWSEPKLLQTEISAASPASKNNVTGKLT
jgi:hypothetical protein